MQCHSKSEKLFSKRIVHEAVTMSGECLNCHSSHSGFTANFLNKPGNQVCYACHKKAKFERKFKHKPATESCSICHDVHSSDNAGLLTVEDQISLCEQCHDAEKTHLHPMGKDYKDPRTNERLVCSSCHSPHSSDYENILYADKQREICILCHSL